MAGRGQAAGPDSDARAHRIGAWRIPLAGGPRVGRGRVSISGPHHPLDDHRAGSAETVRGSRGDPRRPDSRGRILRHRRVGRRPWAGCRLGWGSGGRLRGCGRRPARQGGGGPRSRRRGDRPGGGSAGGSGPAGPAARRAGPPPGRRSRCRRRLDGRHIGLDNALEGALRQHLPSALRPARGRMRPRPAARTATGVSAGAASRGSPSRAAIWVRKPAMHRASRDSAAAGPG